jgi:hypothetical protein
VDTCLRLTVVQIKDALRSLQLPLGGKKAELVARLDKAEDALAHIAATVHAATLAPPAETPPPPPRTLAIEDGNPTLAQIESMFAESEAHARSEEEAEAKAASDLAEKKRAADLRFLGLHQTLLKLGDGSGGAERLMHQLREMAGWEICDTYVGMAGSMGVPDFCVVLYDKCLELHAEAASSLALLKAQKHTSGVADATGEGAGAAYDARQGEIDYALAFDEVRGSTMPSCTSSLTCMGCDKQHTIKEKDLVDVAACGTCSVLGNISHLCGFAQRKYSCRCKKHRVTAAAAAGVSYADGGKPGDGDGAADGGASDGGGSDKEKSASRRSKRGSGSSKKKKGKRQPKRSKRGRGANRSLFADESSESESSDDGLGGAAGNPGDDGGGSSSSSSESDGGASSGSSSNESETDKSGSDAESESGKSTSGTSDGGSTDATADSDVSGGEVSEKSHAVTRSKSKSAPKSKLSKAKAVEELLSSSADELAAVSRSMPEKLRLLLADNTTSLSTSTTNLTEKQRMRLVLIASWRDVRKARARCKRRSNLSRLRSLHCSPAPTSIPIPRAPNLKI